MHFKQPCRAWLTMWYRLVLLVVCHFGKGR